MQLASGDVFAGYTIVKPLGAGGMGEVYLARHPRLPRRDAVKVLPAGIWQDPTFRERFIREADLASGLWHPNVVSVYDRGEHGGQLWIAMEFVDGTDAGRLLAGAPGGLPVKDVLAIVTAVAAALDHAHARGLLHRDVKPANIMLAHHDASEDRRMLLADFGIARPLDEVSGLTTTNMTVGTVAYAAPEQLMGERVDGRADEYSLAATAYHLLSGEQLFPQSNPAVVISRHLNADPPPLAGRRPELAGLDPVLARALAKEPADRYAQCADFARALTAAVSTDARAAAAHGGCSRRPETCCQPATVDECGRRGNWFVEALADGGVSRGHCGCPGGRSAGLATVGFVAHRDSPRAVDVDVGGGTTRYQLVVISLGGGRSPAATTDDDRVACS